MRPVFEVHREDGGISVQGFLQAVTKSVVGVNGDHGWTGQCFQAIGGVVGIGIHPVIEQVAIVIPGV